MAIPPLPDVPCIRVRCIFNKGAVGEGGVHFYLSYTGSAPTGANCTTLAGDISTAWASHISPLHAAYYALEEVDVLDIATTSGLSGQDLTVHNGSRAGTALPVQCALNVEFGVARRYRGGKPRFYLPPMCEADLIDQGHYDPSILSGISTAVGAFFSQIEALSIGSLGTLAHVNLSYYHGYETSSPPWRGPGFKYPPKYRATALHDVVTSYSAKGVVGSQKRRRTSTTP
jgi:hypothetical protein